MDLYKQPISAIMQSVLPLRNRKSKFESLTSSDLDTNAMGGIKLTPK